MELQKNKDNHNDKLKALILLLIYEYKNNLDTLESKAFGISSEAKILEAIESKNIKSNYIDVYTNIMQKVVNFLKENAKYWSIKDGKLQFTNVNKLGEYYQLLNGAESKWQ